MWQAMQTPALKKARAEQTKRDHAAEEAEEAHESALRHARSAAAPRGIRTSDTGQDFVPEVPYAGPLVDHRPVRAIRTPPLRKIHPIPPPRRGEGDGETHPEPARPVAPTETGGPDGAIQTVQGPLVSAPTAASVAFDGVGVGLGGFSPSSNPPDVNGRVGATQYVQWNNSSFAVFDKATGALQYGPAAGNTLFQSLGGVCATHNDGDPVVTYDLLAGRWVLSQFVVAGPAGSFSHQCFAVSATSDALGSYYLYDFVTDTTNFVDYPHVGTWPDGYYMTTHVFNAAGTAQVAARVHVFERDKMIAGLPARQVQKDLSKDGSAFQYGFLPADLDSITPPPAGEASFVLGPNGQFTNRTDSTRVAVTWGATPTIAFTAAVITTVGIVSPTCVGGAASTRRCVPQPSPAATTDYLDHINFHYMYRLAYRNNGTQAAPQESLLVSAVTAGTGTPAHGAIRWIEFRNAGNSTATPTVFQSGTFDPDTSYRWLPSIAMDKDLNVALGYSKSSTAINPGIYMTGRLGSDAVNTMGAETTMQAGLGVQLVVGTNDPGNRWGDYSAMTLDPIDQCTFWYTNEYFKTNGAYHWSTRIATFKFPSCTSAAAWGTISGTVTSCATNAALPGVLVTLSNGYSAASDAAGHYSILVPAGTYTASAADADRNCTSGSPATVSVIATSGATTTQDFCMSGTSNLQSNGIVLNDTAGNNNGIVNKNECVRIDLPLKNNGCATETAISATLTTSTPGVTVTQGTSAYANLVIDAAATNTTPFKFETSNAFVCGTAISFTLNLTYAGGSKAVGVSVPTCAGGPSQSIPSSSLTTADLTQADRLGRDGVPSTCAGKASPGGGFAGTKYYKTFTFNNTSGSAQCFTVNINAALGGPGDIESAAYSPSYNPASISTNYLGDTGIVGLGTTVGSGSYSFTVPALSTFVVVVNTANTTASSVFSGTVSGFVDTTSGPGACPACTPPATPTASNGGPYCEGGTIALSTPTVAGATYAWTGPNSFTSALQNPTRTATLANAGSYSVTVTVAGCTSAAGSTSVVVNATPATPTASNGGPYCEGGTIALSTPTVAGATYAWTGPNSFTSALQNPTRTATLANAGSYSVTVTVAGCTSAAGSTSVVVNATPATPTASNGGPYCEGGTIALSTPTVAGATYAWTGPNSFTSALQNPTRGSATLADAGTYSVTVTVAGCTSAAGSTSVVVNATPATPTASNGGPYCEGGTIALSTPTVAGATYAWTGPNGFTSALQNPTRTATLPNAGTYSVTVTVSGCTSAAGSTNVVVNATPATPSASNGGPYCEGGTIALSTPTVAGATYAWTGPNGFTSALQNPTRTATLANAGSYSVTVTVAGCTSAAGSTTVVVNATPTTPSASNGGPYCEGATIALSTSTVAGASYAWTGPNGFTSALQNPTRSSATLADAGTYSVTVTVAGCTSAAGTTNVVVNATPATPSASNGGPYCENATIALSTPTVAGASYAWTGPNGFTSALQNPTRTATLANAGTYSVTVTVAGCTSAAGSTSVVVNATPATPSASNGGPYCEGGTIALSTPTVAGASYAWTGPNGFTSALQNPTRSSATLADAGTYSVTVTVAGCTSAAGTTNVVVNATPATPTASNGGPYCEGATIALSTPTVAGASYAWTGPNGFTSALQNPTRNSATLADAGTYSVTVTVAGCTSAAGTTNVVVNATPATPTASNGGPFCENGTIALSTPTVAGATYAWTGPNSFTSGLQNPTRTATLANAGTYSVTVTVAGCTSAAGSTSVVVNATPATPTASNGGPYCEGGTIALSTPTVAGATYAWTGPNGFTSALQNPTRTATLANAGSYSVTVTVAGCTSAAGSTSVVVNATPATPTASNGGPYCEGGTIALSTPTVAGATYAWTGPNGFTSALQNPTRSSATLADAGTYSVTVTVAGCTSAAGTTNVVVNATPATPTASNSGPYCENGTIALSTPTVAGATYSWTGPNSFTSALQNPTRTATLANAGTYSVTVTVAGCTSAAGSTSVVVNATPATPTASNGGPYCEGATIALSTPTVAGASYAWTGPNGFTSALQNPTRGSATLADAGTYSVTVTVASCTSAAGTTNVVVNAAPATPTASNGGPYCEGATIALSTPTVAGATYAWTGPNGFTSALQNPTRTATLANAGTYSVTVTVAGCTSAAGSTSVVVNATPATPTASNGGPYCESGTIALSTPTVAGATYAWTGPNGFTSALQNPTRSSATLADAGTYSVTVTVAGCTSAAGTTNVVVNATPATPSASNGGPYCENATIALSTPTVAGATYAWTGPNGFTSALQNPTRTATLPNAGTYSVIVTVSGCTSAAGTTNVVVNAAPATPTASNGGPYCENATIALSTPTVAGATYAWTGPNGFTSALQNPTRSSATLADAGTYSVTVTVAGCTSAAGSTSVVVNATPATPTASNSGPYCEGGTIALSTPTVAGATYAWTGPNSFASALQNPTRTATLANAGTYSVTVTVASCTSAAGSTSVVVNATPTTPSASNGGPYCENATIALSTPTVAGSSYAWTGPNGFTSALQNPTRSSATLADTGTYSVTVTVAGCTSAAGTTNVVVNATPATPTASNGGPYCENATIALATPTVAGATYAWTGPNGFTSALQNPTRSSATLADAGTYSVTVTVAGCTSAAGTTNVVVNATPATPSASNGGPYCENATIALSTPTVAGASYAWTGPNGFTSALQNPTRTATLANAGTYSVTVTVSGCTSAAGSTNVVVNATPATPNASNSGPYCENATIALSTPTVAGATYAWTGPNGFTSALQNPTRTATLPNAGTYSVTVTVSGCTSAAGSTIVVVNVTPATPSASNGGPYCENATIALSTPTVAGATYAWTGPNGFTSALQNPTRSSATLADAGTYSVTVTVAGCTSAAGTTNVVVNATPATPSASNGGPYCENATIALSTPTVAGASYAWTGPNGFTSALQNPTRTATLPNAGTYSVTVTVAGCTSIAGTTNVVVNAAPATPTASNGGPYCENATIALSTPTVAGATYAWTGPNGFTSALQNPTRTATLPNAGAYSVTVTVSGCTSAAGSTNVVVNATPATPSASNGGPYCENATIALSTPTVAGASYAWTGPNGFTSALQNPTRTATLPNAGTYSVTVTVAGCTSAAGSTNVVVNATPATPTATNSGPYCENGTIALTTPTVGGATYAWTGPNGFTSALQNPTRTASLPNAGTYSVTITVAGCTSAAGSTNVVVNVTPATPVITPLGPTSFCPGGSVTLSSSSATGNQWSRNGVPIGTATQQTLLASVAGDYTVVVTGSGCSSQSSAAITVSINPVPNATITVVSSIVSGAAGTASVADAGAGATYAWVIGNGTITGGSGTRSITFTAGAAGTLTLNVTVTNGSGCADSKQANVTVTAAPPSITITSVNPTSAPSVGGKAITITGTGFQSGATVLIGGTPATNVVVVSSTTITAKTPAHAAGTVDLTVTNPDASTFTLAGAMVIHGPRFDANGDSAVDPSDIFYLVNYLFTGGAAPRGEAGLLSGDANGDDVVDPADIFYIVSYLFTGGPSPMSVAPRVSADSEPAPFGGALLLGAPVLRGNRYVVPVIVDVAEGSSVPQALSFKVRLDRAAGTLSVRGTTGVQPAFEISRGGAGEVSYLVAFDPRNNGGLVLHGPTVVAEIELPARIGDARLDFDSAVALLSDAGGTRKATAADGTLKLTGTNIAGRQGRPGAPRKEIQ
jgi:hypothetical protein